MPEDNLMLETIYKNWEKYQNGLIEALETLTPEQLALRAAPNLRSVGEIATHMVGARGRWIYQALGEGTDAADPTAEWDRPDRPIRISDELVAAFQVTWAALREAIARWTPEDLAAPIQREWRGEMHTIYRPWVVWHLIEHDLHHGGELGYSLGMQGLPAPEI